MSREYTTRNPKYPTENIILKRNLKEDEIVYYSLMPRYTGSSLKIKDAKIEKLSFAYISEGSSWDSDKVWFNVLDENDEVIGHKKFRADDFSRYAALGKMTRSREELERNIEAEYLNARVEKVESIDEEIAKLQKQINKLNKNKLKIQGEIDEISIKNMAEVA